MCFDDLTLYFLDVPERMFIDLGLARKPKLKSLGNRLLEGWMTQDKILQREVLVVLLFFWSSAALSISVLHCSRILIPFLGIALPKTLGRSATLYSTV